MRPDVADYLIRRPAEVRGWLGEADIRVFDWLLEQQPPGDLLEIGAYEGASAILMGLHRREGERFTVCDLFAMPEDESANRRDSERWYATLSRERFETNYLRFVSELPDIVQRSSVEITDHVAPGSCRFVHIDGSHVYAFVRADLDSAKTLLAPQGIVVCDDWRGRHTPGVTVAVMESLLSDGLSVIAITASKLYGTWDDELAATLRNTAADWADQSPELTLSLEPIHDEAWPRIGLVNPPEPPTPSIAARIRRLLVSA